MAKLVKSRWLGARIDERLEARVNSYIEVAETTMGDLLRNAVEEYMVNHPVKQRIEPRIDTLKPGVK